MMMMLNDDDDDPFEMAKHILSYFFSPSSSSTVPSFSITNSMVIFQRGPPNHVVTLLIDHCLVGHVREPLLKVCCCGSQSFRRCVCILQCLHVCVIIGGVLSPDRGSAGCDR